MASQGGKHGCTFVLLSDPYGLYWTCEKRIINVFDFDQRESGALVSRVAAGRIGQF
jgi:hypothetical protein